MDKKCKIIKSEYGFTPKNEKVYCFTLSVRKGLTAKIINLGGILTELHVPDSFGNYEDVVLGFNNLETYLDENIYAGAIVGRIAGRLTNGKFNLNGKSYQLTRNEQFTHLHGGNKGLDKKLWEPEIIKIDGNEALMLRYQSPEWEEGYPGNLDISVVYSLTPENGLCIKIEAVTDHVTPFCPTNHSYFNLAGKASKIVVDHLIQIDSELIAEVNEDFLPTGKIKPVEPLLNDFRQAVRLGDRVKKLYKSHGDLYLLKPSGNRQVKIANLLEPYSGRNMEIYTTASCLQFYTGTGLQTNGVGKTGHQYGKFAGVCFECQEFADAPNHKNFKSNFIYPNKVFGQTTEYRFSCR